MVAIIVGLRQNPLDLGGSKIANILRAKMGLSNALIKHHPMADTCAGDVSEHRSDANELMVFKKRTTFNRDTNNGMRHTGMLVQIRI